MKQSTRELLVTTKVAQSWHEDFDRNVDELMNLFSKVDDEKHVEDATELLNVYHNKTQEAQKSAKRKKMVQNERPFEFLVFRN